MAQPKPFPIHLLDGAARQRLRVRRNTPALVRLAVHVAALCATGFWIDAWRGSGWVALPVVAHGVLLVFLFAPLHETIHDTAFRGRALNRIVATVLGYVLLLPAAYFRHFHMAHHRLTQQPGDPELSELTISSLPRYLLQLSGLPLWRERVTTLLRHAAGRIGEPFIPPRRRVAITAEAWSFVLTYGAVGLVSMATGTWDAVLWLWLLPLVVAQPFLRAFLLAEHTGRPRVADMLQNSRTTKSNALVRALAWNMPYHIEHHALPWVPYHALPQAHALLRPHLGEEARGYLAVHSGLIRGLRT